MQQIVVDIRRQLAKVGIEFTPADLEELLNVGAVLASKLGGFCYFDCGEFWGMDITIDPDDPTGQRCDVNVLLFDVEEDEADIPEEDLN